MFFRQLSTFKSNIFLTRKLRVFLTDTVMNFRDWNLTWLPQLKPTVKVGQSL